VGNQTGLSTLLKSNNPIKLAELQKHICQSKVNNLDVLPSGPASGNIGDLLHSPRLPEVFALLRQHYDTVVVDSPPMIQMADARILAKYADGVILVIRSSKTPRESALLAKQRLKQDGTAIFGTVLNDWNPKEANVGTDSYYSYYEYSEKKAVEAT
jgi:polysaccharide biosynthesis transport protein